MPEPKFASVDCGNCFVEMPAFEVTENDFVTLLSSQKIKFHLPGNFYVNEIQLLDTNNRTTIKRKWRVPYRSLPIGISHDENVIYLGFDDLELAGLSIAVFGEGTFQICTRDEAEDGGKGKIESNIKGSDPAFQLVRFDRWKNTYVVRFKPPCP